MLRFEWGPLPAAGLPRIQPEKFEDRPLGRTTYPLFWDPGNHRRRVCIQQSKQETYPCPRRAPPTEHVFLPAIGNDLICMDA